MSSFRTQLPFDRLPDAEQVAGPDEYVDFGQGFAQLVRVALGETARDDEPASGPRGLDRRQVEDGGDGFLLRRLDEAAGVHHQHVGRRRVEHELMPLPREHPEHDLAVHPVLRATEGQEVDPPRLSRGSW